MKTAALLAAAVASACVASYFVSRASAPAPAVAGDSNATAAALEKLSAELAEIRARDGALRGELETLRTQLAARPSGDARVPLADIEDAVARALAAQARGAATASGAETSAAAAPAKRTANQALDAILAAQGDWDAVSAEFKKLREEGLVDDVLKLMEERAKSRSNDPKAQVELGQAYLQKLFSVPAGPEQGLWASKADKAFDSALALDDHHWEARFNKAISLSNWPAFMGKQAEAARQFETLLEQQKAGDRRPEHSQTYFFLGNLYQSMGKTEQALATWRAGLELFPDNARLSQQIAAAAGH